MLLFEPKRLIWLTCELDSKAAGVSNKGKTGGDVVLSSIESLFYWIFIK